LLDADQSLVAVDASPLEGAELAETEAGSERDVEEVDVEEVAFAGTERIVGGERGQRFPDRLRAIGGEFLAGEILGWREVGAAGGVGGEEAVADGVVEQLAQRDDDVADGPGCTALVFEVGDQVVDVDGAEARELSVAEAGEDVSFERAPVLTMG
jgi:hypothetical protein